MTPEALAPLAALAAAAAFGAGVQAQGRAVREMDAVAGALIGVTVATLIFAAAAPFAVRPEWVFSEATLWFALCGLFMPALSMILAIRSVGLAGPALTAALGAFSPFFAVAPAVLLLGEAIGPQAVAGLLLMTGGLAVSPFAGGRGCRARRCGYWRCRSAPRRCAGPRRRWPRSASASRRARSGRRW